MCYTSQMGRRNSYQTVENIKQVHSRSFVTKHLKEIVHGGVDGIVVTFAIVAGFAGATLSSDTALHLSLLVVLLFGFANLIADAAAKGLANYLSVRTEKDYFHNKRETELALTRRRADVEISETTEILITEGFGEDDAKTLAQIYSRNEKFWIDFMMDYEVELADPRRHDELMMSLATTSSFIVFGTVPLIPFVLASTVGAGNPFVYSVVGTFAALGVLALLKWRVSGKPFFPALVETVAVGSVAAGIAYIVGTFFHI